LSISQKALGTLPEDGNVMPKHVKALWTLREHGNIMPKHVGVTIYN
jgi:hypothetical protein